MELMYLLLSICIVVLGVASYAIGIKQMLQGAYAPSTYSRVIWLLLAINSFFGVLLSGSKSSLLLATILLGGNLAMCIVSLWKGTRQIGVLEYICTLLLIISGLIWIFFHAPIINLVISLFAHFVGGMPTYKKAWKYPESESVSFWSLFFLASLLSIITAQTVQIDKIILPVYFTLFDGSMFLLALRSIFK